MYDRTSRMCKFLTSEKLLINVNVYKVGVVNSVTCGTRYKIVPV